jgi:hypothetical protein
MNLNRLVLRLFPSLTMQILRDITEAERKYRQSATTLTAAQGGSDVR